MQLMHAREERRHTKPHITLSAAVEFRIPAVILSHTICFSTLF